MDEDFDFGTNGLSLTGLNPPDEEQGLENLTDFQGSAAGGASGGGMDILTSALKGISAYQELQAGADLSIQGGDYQAAVYRSSGQAALQGAQYQAEVYRQAGLAATMAANYNVALDQQTTARQQDALSRQITGAVGSNIGTGASKGISISSKSSMMVNNSVLSQGERQTVQMKNDALQRQALINYQGLLTQTNYENQARASEYSGAVAVENAENQARGAEYQGQVDAYKANLQASDSITNSAMSMLGQLGGM